MDIKDFKAGSYRKGYEHHYFLPEKINHSFFWTNEAINELLEKASLKLGELNSFSRFVPDTDMFIIMHIFKEAVVSSRIEGTQTNIEEALIEEKEIEPERRDDCLLPFIWYRAVFWTNPFCISPNFLKRTRRSITTT